MKKEKKVYLDFLHFKNYKGKLIHIILLDVFPLLKRFGKIPLY